MYRISRLFLSVFLLTGIVSCNNSDINEIQNQLRQHEQEIQRLKGLVDAANGDIRAMEISVQQIRNGGYVTSVIPDEKDGTLVGYTITFGSGESIYVSNGIKETPKIGIKSYNGGDYYWTLDDEWLLNDSGNMIAVEEGSGTPLFKAEGGNWYVSLDDGNTWIMREGATTSTSAFKTIDTSNPNYVLITLADGTVLQLTTWSAHVALKNLVNQLNNNLAATRSIVDALGQSDYLLSATPMMENGRQTGWRFEFAKSGLVEVFASNDITQGQDQIVKMEDGYWWVSGGSGEPFVMVDAAENGGGVYIISIDNSDSESVALLLSDGSSVAIPRKIKTALQVNLPEEEYILNMDETLSFSYALTGTCAPGSVVTAFSDGNFVTEVRPETSTGGIITVRCTARYTKGYIAILVNDTSGYSITRVINFKSQEEETGEAPYDPVEIYPYRPDVDFYCGERYLTIPGKGGSCPLEVISTFGISYAYPSDLWLNISSEQPYYAHFNFKFSAEENPYPYPRAFTMYIPNIGSVRITQEGNPDAPANPYWERDYLLLPEDGSAVTITVKSSVRNIHCSYPGWLHLAYGPQYSENGETTISITADPNNNLGDRNGRIAIDCGDARGVIEVVQLAKMRI